MSLGFLDELYRAVLERLRERPAGSYTVGLAEKGLPYVARKLGEEAVETVVEALRGDVEGVVEEAADLLYHLVVLLALMGVEPSRVAEELEARRR